MDPKQAKSLLVVVAKAPVPGEVKTRLVPHFTYEQAAGLYECFLRDRMLTLQAIEGVDRAVAYTPSDAGDMFVPFSRNGIGLFSQNGKDLGQRLNNIFVEKLAAGYGAVCIIDSDTPDLPPQIVQESFKRLLANQTDVVLGPCYDGGYYLVGMRQPHPGLFDDIAWSTETVLSNTLERAEKIGAKTDLLHHWNDLDTFEDLVAFFNKYKNQRPAGRWAGEQTFSFLAQHQRIKIRAQRTRL